MSGMFQPMVCDEPGDKPIAINLSPDFASLTLMSPEFGVVATLPVGTLPTSRLRQVAHAGRFAVAHRLVEAVQRLLNTAALNVDEMDEHEIEACAFARVVLQQATTPFVVMDSAGGPNHDAS